MTGGRLPELVSPSVWSYIWMYIKQHLMKAVYPTSSLPSEESNFFVCRTINTDDQIYIPYLHQSYNNVFASFPLFRYAFEFLPDFDPFFSPPRLLLQEAIGKGGHIGSCLS